jgi:hypothetical protein
VTVDRLVHTEIVAEPRRWAVFLVVIDQDGVDRRRLSTHATEREAALAAALARRRAERGGPPPPGRQW